MAGLIKKIFRVCVIAIVAPFVAFGAQSPRTASSKVLTRNQTIDTGAAIRRSATSVIARSTSANSRRSKMVVTARPAVARTAKNKVARSGTRVISNNANLSRAAVANKSGIVRSATTKGKESNTNHLSRAASSRATAVFNDITKIGGGYSNCRDAYATCMDQFCANANDTYRRCFCSDRFLNFKETSDNLDRALEMLADFQDNNLNAIDKTAAEVDAMYSATVGEEAIKKDTSASQRLLDEISDVLSGKKSTNSNKKSSSLNIINFGDLSDVGDIWGGSDFSIFSQSSGDNISALEGDALYKRASNQCAAITRESCSGDAMFNLASSAYSIMVTQDCNTFEKSINAKKENVTQTVRKAEQVLREARLEEYRAHNSQDVNECLEKVETAMTQPLVCGENYVKCLDYTNKYINATTGEPIYEQLFNLSSIAPTLVDSGDVLSANSNWNSFLEGKRMYATTALDTCRSISGDVWPEFKRMALIRIAQAQDDIIQTAKDNCISVIKECYNSQTGELNNLGETEDDQYNFGAGAVATARGICYERVMGCAALYGNPGGCQYDKATRKFSAVEGQVCGLQSLLNFVDTVDSAKVAAECERTLTARAHELCEPTSTYKKNKDGSYVIDELTDDYVVAEYPDGCADMPKSQLRADLTQWANKFCALDMIKNDNSNTIRDTTKDDAEVSAFNTDIVNRVIKEIFDKLGIAFTQGCEDAGGIWYGNIDAILSWQSGSLTVNDLNKDFYDKYYGGTSLQSILGSINAGDVGVCLNESAKETCERIAGAGKYDDKTNECDISMSDLCTWLNGTPDNKNGCQFGYNKKSSFNSTSKTGQVSKDLVDKAVNIKKRVRYAIFSSGY